MEIFFLAAVLQHLHGPVLMLGLTLWWNARLLPQHESNMTWSYSLGFEHVEAVCVSRKNISQVNRKQLLRRSWQLMSYFTSASSPCTQLAPCRSLPQVVHTASISFHTRDLKHQFWVSWEEQGNTYIHSEKWFMGLVSIDQNQEL